MCNFLKHCVWGREWIQFEGPTQCSKTNSVIFWGFIQSHSVTSLCSPFTAFILFLDISQLCPFQFLHFSNFSLSSFLLPLCSSFSMSNLLKISVTCPFCFIRYIVIKRKLGHSEASRDSYSTENAYTLIWPLTKGEFWKITSFSILCQLIVNKSKKK